MFYRNVLSVWDHGCVSEVYLVELNCSINYLCACIAINLGLTIVFNINPKKWRESALSTYDHYQRARFGRMVYRLVDCAWLWSNPSTHSAWTLR